MTSSRLAIATAVALIVLVQSATAVAPQEDGPFLLPPREVHTEVFADGSAFLEDDVSLGTNLVGEFAIAAGATVINASIDISRVRFNTSFTPLNDTPRTLWCGDMDGDGLDDDILVTLPKANRVDHLHLSGAELVPTLKGSFPVVDPTSVKVWDLDRDGDSDVLVTSGSRGRLVIFEALPMGRYADAIEVPVGARPSDIAIHDLDQDFKWDVVVANSGSSSVSVLQGRGDLTFYPNRTELGPGPQDIALYDIDRDGDQDIVVAASRDSNVSILFNVGNVNFTDPVMLPVGPGPVDLDVRDMSGDSLPDIAIACAESGEVHIWRQGSNLTFHLWEVLPVGEAPRAVSALHMNRREDKFNRDIVTTCSGSDNVTIYMADGALNHTIPLEVPVGGRPVDLVAMDIIKGDDKQQELVVACQMPPSLVIVQVLEVAEVISVGLGLGGEIRTVELPPGTERATVNLTDSVAQWVVDHHIQATAGNITVQVVAKARFPGRLRMDSVCVWYAPNRAPRANAGSDLKVDVGEDAELNGSASYDPEGHLATLLWLLPEGEELMGEVVMYAWDEPGPKTVLLQAVDIWGLQDIDEVEVMVNSPPKAAGEVPATVIAWEPVTLSAHLSEDLDGTIVDYLWDYGLGVVHGRTVEVTFTGSGTRVVTLEVIDIQGSRDTATFEVEVLPAEEPIRPPGEEEPPDQGEIPGPTGVAATIALLGAAIVYLARRRRPS
jgi:hypothetical protein